MAGLKLFLKKSRDLYNSQMSLGMADWEVTTITVSKITLTDLWEWKLIHGHETHQIVVFSAISYILF